MVRSETRRLVLLVLLVTSSTGCVDASGSDLDSASAVMPARSAGSSPRLPSIVPPTLSVRVPDSIDGTGRLDVAQPLQAFIDGVPDGRVVEFPPLAIFRLGEALLIDGRRNLVLKGNGATLTGEGCEVADSLIVVGRTEPSRAIEIRGFRLQGSNDRGGTPDAYEPGCEYQMGVAVYGSRDVEIFNTTIADVNGDCLYVGPGEGGAWSDGIWFHESSCTRTGRMGVAIVAGRNVTVERVKLDDIAILVFDIEPNDPGGGGRYVAFQDNTIGTYGHSSRYTGYFFAANGNEDAVIANVVVSNNLVTEGTLKTLVGNRNRRNIVMRNNTARVASGGPVMRFTGVRGVTVSRNVQPLHGGELAEFNDCTDVTYDG